jgi:hypothetical protein
MLQVPQKKAFEERMYRINGNKQQPSKTPRFTEDKQKANESNWRGHNYKPDNRLEGTARGNYSNRGRSHHRGRGNHQGRG